MPQPPEQTIVPDSIPATDAWLKRLTSSLAAHTADADDARQETWLAALSHAGDRGLSPAWYARVATNFLRKQRRTQRRRISREAALAKPEAFESNTAGQVEQSDAWTELLRHVSQLHEPYRSTIVLRYYENRSVEDIARLQRASPNTVRTRLRRGLAILRKRLPPDRSDENSALQSLPLLSLLKAPSAPAQLQASSAILPHLARYGLISMTSKTTVSILAIAAVIGVSGLLYSLRDPVIPDSSNDANQRVAGSEMEAAQDVATTEALSEKTAQRATADPSTSLAAPDDPTVSREITEEGESARVSHDPKRIELATRTRGPEAQKVFDALTQLRAVFGEGGRTGWRGLGQSIGDFQPLVGKSDEAFEEFLTLLDEETDASFLESLLHHLPLARTEGQAAILEDKDLHAEIWARFENDEADDRRLAFLRFFAFNRKLVTPRMDAFLKIAKNETAGPVRQLGIDAVASNVDVISDTWETLAWVFENDPELSHQQTALHGLAYAESERAASIVVGAFQSADESLRAAAWKSAAGNSPPESVVGSDTDSFLRSELLEAKSSEYKLALIPHMLKHRTEELVPLLERLVGSEKDWTVKREYRRAIQSLQQDTAQP